MEELGRGKKDRDVMETMKIVAVGFTLLACTSVGCKSGPGWEWWRVGAKTPSESSPIARSASADLPSQLAQQQGMPPGGDALEMPVVETSEPTGEMLASHVDGSATAPPYQTTNTGARASNTIAANAPNSPYDSTGYPSTGSSPGTTSTPPYPTTASVPGPASPGHSAAPGSKPTTPTLPAPNSNDRYANSQFHGIGGGRQSPVVLPSEQTASTPWPATNQKPAANPSAGGTQMADASAGGRYGLPDAPTTPQGNTNPPATRIAQNPAATPAMPYRPGGTGDYSVSTPPAAAVASRPAETAAPSGPESSGSAAMPPSAPAETDRYGLPVRQ